MVITHTSIRKSNYSPSYKGGAWGWLFLILALFSACQSHPAISPEEQARRDSAALHVALMPVADCLPFYVAQRTGIYDRLGLDLRIHTLWAQLDTDTALLRRRVHAAYSDLVRAIMIQQTDTFDLRAVAALPGDLQLITNRRGRVRKLGQLKERMVAVSRHSITDYWSDRLMDSARMAQTDIFRPQINDVRIRTDMICNGTMDAAFLPEPFAHEALLRGNTRNFSTRGLQPLLGAYLVPTWVLGDSTRMRQLRLLFQGYEEARTLRDSIPSLLRDLCLTPDSIVDSIARALPAFQPLERPSKEQADAALRWLSTREKAGQKYTTDTLIVDFYGLKSIQ
jgi:NitT/TauT family transport system substrate-binding protein